MEEVAAAAGTTRQTVYAHFPSRDALIIAVVHSIREEGLAALEAARLDELDPVAAMRAFLRISWQLLERCAVLLEPVLSRISETKSEKSRHDVLVKIEAIIRRGQETGDFDDRLPLDWLVAAVHSLGHTAAEQVLAGKLSTAESASLLEASVLLLCGADLD